MANVIAVVGLAGTSSGAAPGATPIEDLWSGLADEAGPSNGSATGAGGPARSFRELAADVLQGVAWTDRIGLYLRGAGEDEPAAAVAAALGLHGPALAVEGPALAAVERACRELRAAACDLALAGEAPIRDGGAAVAALKRLTTALADGDHILGAIHGEAFQSPAPAPTLPSSLGPDPQGPATPPRERPALANPYTPPGNPLEAAIAGVWREQLGVAEVGVDDNFFELGGSSIAGVKIVALLKEWLQQDIPTVSLYEGPTVRALAQVLLQGGQAREFDAMRERGERRRRKLQRLQGLARAED